MAVGLENPGLSLKRPDISMLCTVIAKHFTRFSGTSSNKLNVFSYIIIDVNTNYSDF